jgi:septal ring factor EnvC (AmiA/AmiB activator)
VGGFTANFRELAAGEDEYQALAVTTKLYIEQMENEHASELKAVKASYESQLEASENRIDQLEEELDQTRNDLADARAKLENAMNQITDLTAERDAAISENEALKKQIEELRAKLTEKPVVTNLDGAAELAAIKERIEAKKPKIYNVRPGDLKSSFYLANLVETDEEITIPWTQLSKYKEVSAEEAATFRAQIEAEKKAVLESVPEVSEDVTTLEAPELFPPSQDTHDTETVGQSEGVAGDTSVSQVVGAAEAVTREEFEALVKRVDELEGIVSVKINQVA